MLSTDTATWLVLDTVGFNHPQPFSATGADFLGLKSHSVELALHSLSGGYRVPLSKSTIHGSDDE